MSADKTCPDGISAGRSDVGNELDLFAGVKLVLRRRGREIEQQGGYHNREHGGFETSSRSLESVQYDHFLVSRAQDQMNRSPGPLRAHLPGQFRHCADAPRDPAFGHFDETRLASKSYDCPKRSHPL